LFSIKTLKLVYENVNDLDLIQQIMTIVMNCHKEYIFYDFMNNTNI